MSLNLAIEQQIRCKDIIDIAIRAGEAILEVYHSDDFGIERKADNSPVTKADQAANALICRELARVAPHIPIVSEENKQVSYDIRKGYKYSWCVDPLDGTKEFLKRNGQFTVNIALLEDDTPIMGVVQIPVENKVYWACRGQGAFIHENGTDRRIRAASFKLSDPGLRLVGSSSHNSPATQEFISRFQDPSFLQLGSSIKLLKVADGSADLYPRMAPTCEWDTAAAHAVVAEAGGKVIAAGKCDGKGNSLEDWKAAVAANKPVVYNKENNLNPFFVVYGACDLE
ncbi:inositol monophosphatase [Helicosporidium sp. ATCC 50920]|nr:inositol monophosphatase [Helicosporidium sp. ATCC 50920]|eukprot:KDD76927.1 inositol monophosphatase [Helicosporidium sp. ATCC 50920]